MRFPDKNYLCFVAIFVFDGKNLTCMLQADQNKVFLLISPD